MCHLTLWQCLNHIVQQWASVHCITGCACQQRPLNATTSQVLLRADCVSLAVHSACVCSGHRAVGMTTIAMMLVQVLLGCVRPHLGGKWRPMWKRMHQAWGWLVLLMGESHKVYA